jgi:hypothetical protein
MKFRTKYKLLLRAFKISVVFIALFNCANIYSQQPAQATAENKTTQPLELPNFIIEGREQLNVQTGVKQFPTRTAPLSSAELDSINTIQKQQAILLSPKSLPSIIFNNTYKKGFIIADIGNYLTGNLNAGYEIKSNEYSFFGNALFNHTDGHVKNSDETKGALNLQVDYIAPKKFWIFGGSKTRGIFSVNSESFKLYAINPAPERKSQDIKLGIESEGEFNGYKFITGAGVKTLRLSHAGTDRFDNAVCGHIQLRKETSEFEFNLGSEVQFHGISGSSSNFISVGGGVKLNLEQITFDLNGAFQSVGSTDDIQRANIAINAAFDYRISKLLTFKAILDVAFENNHLFELYAMNKYIENNPLVNFTYHKYLKTIINFHPNMNIMASAGLKIGSNERYKYFELDTSAEFKLKYASTQDIEIFADIAYKLSAIDDIFGSVSLRNLTFSDSLSNKIPFVPSLKLSAYYNRKWTEEFGTQIGVNYYGSRYSDYNNLKQLDGFVNLNFELDYKLNDYLKFYGKIDNLTNSEIYIWEKYKEREIYISAGIIWQF